MTISQTYQRVWSIDAGRVMVVTDLHGDWELYQHYRDRFVDGHAKGAIDWWVITGDLIHHETPGDHDQSLRMVCDVLALQQQFDGAVVYLCGNHELPHIYSFSLAKGQRNYTKDFERALSDSGSRADIIDLFRRLPLYLRTKAGVSLTHAGASTAAVEPDSAARLFNLDHGSIIEWGAIQIIGNTDSLRRAYAKLMGQSYDELTHYYLAVDGPGDPRYDDMLRGFFLTAHPDFDKLLWPALFSRCEDEYGADYPIFLDALLTDLSVEYERQNFLVAGHMGISGGHQVVAQRHLRLASGLHARPQSAREYLLFDAAQPIASIEALLAGIHTL